MKKVHINMCPILDLGNHLLQLCPKVVKHPVYMYIYVYVYIYILLKGYFYLKCVFRFSLQILSERVSIQR